MAAAGAARSGPGGKGRRGGARGVGGKPSGHGGMRGRGAVVAAAGGEAAKGAGQAAIGAPLLARAPVRGRGAGTGEEEEEEEATAAAAGRRRRRHGWASMRESMDASVDVGLSFLALRGVVFVIGFNSYGTSPPHVHAQAAAGTR